MGEPLYNGIYGALTVDVVVTGTDIHSLVLLLIRSDNCGKLNIGIDG